MVQITFWILILLYVAEAILSKYLAHLNRVHSDQALPLELKALCSDAEFRKQKLYRKASRTLSRFEEPFSVVMPLLLIVAGGFGWYDEFLRTFSENSIILALLFMGSLGFAQFIVGLPFAYFHTFRIETRFGFNKQSKGLFFVDQLKGLLLSTVLGGGVLGIIVALYQWLGTDFWWLAWAFVAVLTTLITMFYTSWFVPIFNTLKPLESGELRDAIEEFSKKTDFDLQNVFVIDGSKRSSKANAYFSGLGRRKKIVLYDTLIDQLSVREIVAVLAHEIGHYKHKHTRQGMWTGMLQVGLTLFVLSLALNYPFLSEALGGKTPSFHLGLLAFGILYSPVSFVSGLIFSSLSRSNEFQADAFAARLGLGESLIDALIKLSRENLSNLNPHPWFVKVYYSHPPLIQRIHAIRKLEQ